MTYVHPTDVRTPRKNVKGVHVLYDGAEDSFSIAVLNWADESGESVDKLALRWNGSEESLKDILLLWEIHHGLLFLLN